MSILDHSVKVNRSRPPLRWIANWAGDRASVAIRHLSWAEDNDRMDTFQYRFDAFIWEYLFKLYCRYGTYYEIETMFWEKTGTVDPDYQPEFDPDLNCICSNCDEYEHCSGCLECESDFEDEETGDAFRIL